MNRFGSSAGVIALLVFLLHIAVPGGQDSRNEGAPATGNEDGSTAKKPKSAAGTDSSEAKDSSGTGMTAQEGPWLATRRFFRSIAIPENTSQLVGKIDLNSADDVLHCPAGCASMIPPFFGIPEDQKANIQFLVATVPDPVHSRLSLFTDSSLDAIQKAATDTYWLFATEWLPWNGKAGQDDPAQRASLQNREKQPGILVFRHSNIKSPAVLVIFVVGETPTSGIDAAQFRLARAYMRAIHEPDRIRIQGPTFSGSLYSLRRLIDEDMNKPRGGYLVRSGTETDLDAAGEFGGEVDFKTAMAPPDLGDVLTRLGISTNDAAVLAEDETQFGGGVVAAKGNRMVRSFRFPRDISHLRNAYREVPQKSGPNGAPVPDLDFSIKDTDTGEDSIPTFSTTQTPLAQDAVLSEITGSIRRDRIRIVQIVASNVLDVLFLARILRQQCPETRILIFPADLLFVEAAQTQALTGTLALSTYPLFTASNDWMGEKDVPYTFSSASAEGVYNASMLLLDPCRLADYHWPGELAGSPSHPPEWLLMLDRQGFAPLNIWRESRDFLADASAPYSPGLRLPKPPALWTLLATLTALISLFQVTLTVLLRRYPALTIHPAFAIEITNSPSDRLRLYFLSLLAVLLAALQFVLVAPFWFERPGWQILLTKMLPAAGILPVLFCGVFAVLQNRGGRKPSRICEGLSIVAVLAVPVVWFLCCGIGGEKAFFFRFRAAELRLGTSPIWPVFAALCVLILFSLVHLTRHYLAVYEKPELAVGGFDTVLRQPIREAYHSFNKSVESPVAVPRRCPGAFAIGIAVVLAALLFAVVRPWVQLSSIDGAIYDSLAITLMLAASGALLLVCWDVTVLWRSLQDLLKCLNALPLARAFIPPDHSGSSAPVWFRTFSLQSVDLHAQALAVWNDMLIRRPDWPGGSGLLKSCTDQMRQLLSAHPRCGRLGAWTIRRRIRNINKEVAREAFRVARESWIENPLAEQRGKSESATGEEPLRPGFLEINRDPKNIGDLAETFLALHYSAFLIYGVRQIRNLMLFLSIGFVLLVLSMNSYSHQSPQFIGRLLMILFVLIGAVLWTCLTGMERDPILSRINGTRPGKLTAESYVKALGYGALPVMGLLASQFPSISNFLYSWIAPTLQAVH